MRSSYLSPPPPLPPPPSGRVAGVNHMWHSFHFSGEDRGELDRVRIRERELCSFAPRSCILKIAVLCACVYRPFSLTNRFFRLSSLGRGKCRDLTGVGLREGTSSRFCQGSNKRGRPQQPSVKNRGILGLWRVHTVYFGEYREGRFAGSNKFDKYDWEWSDYSIRRLTKIRSWF